MRAISSMSTIFPSASVSSCPRNTEARKVLDHTKWPLRTKSGDFQILLGSNLVPGGPQGTE